MMWWIGVSAGIFILGIIFIMFRTGTKKTAQEFMQELAEYMGGFLEPGEGQGGALRVRFQFEGTDFVFEMMEEESFSGKNNRYFLKTQLPEKFTLDFSERQKSAAVQSKIFMASKIDGGPQQEVTIEVPKALQDFNIHTNNPKKVRVLFGEDKIVNIFASFKNYDPRHYPSSSLTIRNGIIILEFSTAISYQPNIMHLLGDVGSIEPYLGKLLILKRILEKETN